MGAQTREEVLHAYKNADVFVLPCKVARNGARDGLPHVLMEAQCQGGRVYLDPDLGNSRVNSTWGNRVIGGPWRSEGRPLQITRFIGDFDLRMPAEAGRERVMSEFAFEECIETVAIKFGLDKADTTQEIVYK